MTPAQDPGAVSDEALLATTVELVSQVEALAALAAYARLGAESIPADPAVRAQLERVVRRLLGSSTLPSGPVVAQAVGLATAMLRYGVDLVADPGRAGGWDRVDPPLLQGIGRISGAVAGAIAAAAPHLDGLAGRLGDGGRVLDVGTGTGWLAIALARTFGAAMVVGIDVFDAPLALARDNVVAEGLTDRVELRLTDVLDLRDDDGFDAAWVALPFLPVAIVPEALAAVRRAMRPGGWVLPGVFAGPPEPLAEELIALRTVRWGGTPWSADDTLAVMRAAGLGEVHEIPRTWAAPLRLFAGRA